MSERLSQPQRILLYAAMNEMGACGKYLRESGWDATLTVHTIPELHVALTIPVNVGQIPVEVSGAANSHSTPEASE